MKENKKLDLLLGVITVIILVSLVSGAVYIFNKSTKNFFKAQAFETCKNYEKSGSLPVGSCDCTSKLFDDFSQSYDWKDSCYILKQDIANNPKVDK